MEASDSALRGPAADSSREPLLAGALLLSLAFAAIGYNPYNISSDAAMYLQCGELMLAGQVPYVDFIDLNPPLIMYLNTIPAWIANAAGTHPIAVFNVMVILATAASMLATHRIVSRAEDPGAARMAGWLAAGIAAVTLGCVLQKQQGQREHMFFLAYAPFLVLRWARGAGARVPLAAAIFIGGAAGLMAALKPHFVFIAAIPEIARMFQRRGPKPWQGAEIWSALAVVALYAAHLATLPQSMYDAFWGRIYWFVRYGYDSYDAPMAELLNHPFVWLAAVASVLVALLRMQNPGAMLKIAQDFAAAALAAALMFFVQRKAWEYQAIPAIGLLVLFVAILLPNLRFSEELDGRVQIAISARVRKTLNTAFALIAMAIGCGLLLTASPENRLKNPLAILIREQSASSDSILVLSTGVNPGYPALTLASRQPGSRYLWSFPVPSEARATRRIEYIPTPFESELAEDIRGRKPALILIEAAECQACPDGFNLRKYFESAPEVGGLLKEYSEIGMVGGAVILKRAAAGP